MSASVDPAQSGSTPKTRSRAGSQRSLQPIDPNTIPRAAASGATATPTPPPPTTTSKTTSRTASPHSSSPRLGGQARKSGAMVGGTTRSRTTSNTPSPSGSLSRLAANVSTKYLKTGKSDENLNGGAYVGGTAGGNSGAAGDGGSEGKRMDRPAPVTRGEGSAASLSAKESQKTSNDAPPARNISDTTFRPLKPGEVPPPTSTKSGAQQTPPAGIRTATAGELTPESPITQISDTAEEAAQAHQAAATSLMNPESAEDELPTPTSATGLSPEAVGLLAGPRLSRTGIKSHRASTAVVPMEGLLVVSTQQRKTSSTTRKRSFTAVSPKSAFLKDESPTFGAVPRYGGWVGWFTIVANELVRVFYEMNVTITTDGILRGEAREECAPFQCTGKVTTETPQKITFTETQKQFEGVYVESAIAGRWRRVGSHATPGASHGRLALFRVSDLLPPRRMTASGSKSSLLAGYSANLQQVVFRAGRWAGCCWNELEGVWESVYFPWLEVKDKKDVYGKDEWTDDNVFRTTRGLYEGRTGRIKLFVTEWFDQDSTVSVYSGRVIPKDGHIKGTKVCSGDPDFEELLTEIEAEEDAESKALAVLTAGGKEPEKIAAAAKALEPDLDEGASFRMWPVDGVDCVDWLEGLSDSSAVPFLAGKWSGTWIYDGGVKAPDNCIWELKYSPVGSRIVGAGITILDGLEEGFFCDGTYNLQTKEVKLYQTFTATLTIYVYNLRLDTSDRMIGRGSSKDDSNGLVVDFILKHKLM